MAISTHETRFLLTAKDKTKAALAGTKTNLKSVGKAVTGLHAQLLGLAGIGGLGALVTGIVNTNAEMQTLKSSLKTVTGSSEAAAKAFEKIEKFAVTTPYDLKQWTEAFIKMKALGLDPSEAALSSYGNTAAAMGKDLNQMIEAVADAATGEFERLKEFGIKASKQGEEITFTFQGVTTTVKNNAAEIEAYLQRIGNNQFGGAMADQMDNLKPAFSNLKQSLANIAVQIGEAGLNEMVTNLAHDITDLANSFDPMQFREFMTVVGGGLYAIKETLASVSRGYAGLIDLIGGPGAGDIRTPAVPGYQLGDFNQTGGNLEYMKQLESMREKYGEKMAGEQSKTNRILENIDATLKNQNNFAVAG